MTEEYDSFMKNQSWKLVERPKKQRLIGCKWTFKKEGEDYNEIFSHVVKHTNIRVI